MTSSAFVGSHTAALMAPIGVRLSDLDLAPENLRFDEPADEGIPQLAETIVAAGLLLPLLVRAGRGNAAAYGVLDGRRRLLALRLLLERGLITADHVVDCVPITSKAGQAAAVLLPNAEREPIHVADVIVAIGRLRSRKMSIADIAKALGYEPVDVRRLDALAGIVPQAITALRQGKLSLRQARLLARLDDRQTQTELAQASLDGDLDDWALRGAVDKRRVRVDDPRMALVGLDRYRQAGGRLEGDLFGELPEILLDPEILETQWRAAVQPLVDRFEALDLAVHVSRIAAGRAPDGYESLPYVYTGDLDAETRGRLDAAREALAEAKARVVDRERLDEDVVEDLWRVLRARLALSAVPLDGQTIGAVWISPQASEGVEVRFFVTPHVAPQRDEAEAGADAE